SATIQWIDSWNLVHHGRIGLGISGGPSNMSYLARVISPRFSGYAKITQLCTIDFSGIDGTCSGCLDNDDPYPNTSIFVNRNSNPQGNVNVLNFDDAPQAPGYESVRMNGTFVDYIMFSPGGSGDIYVTLGISTWSTSAAASY